MNLDHPIDRNLYPTMKWSPAYLGDHFGNVNALPMSVADMDWQAPQAVVDALQRRVSHGIYGYEYKPDGFFQAMLAWFEQRHNWPIQREHIEFCPGILSAISILIDQHSDEGHGVIVQPPVFFEFRMLIRSSGRQFVKNSLKFEAGHYTVDFEDLEAKAADSNNKILILCNPHNPVGRVWTRAELTRVADICLRHDVFVISDEIHGDFALHPHQFTPYLTISEEAAQHAAACISPAKTFNISGMVDAMAIIPNKAYRKQFNGFAHRYQINKINVFATEATQTAYESGHEWLDELLDYVAGNVAYIEKFLTAHELGVSLVRPEGTFLAWLDFRGLNLGVKELAQFLGEKAGIAVGQGYWFGREGAGFGRMTIGCPRATVAAAMEQLAEAVGNR